MTQGITSTIHENERIQTLQEYRLHDIAAENNYDHILQLAARLFHAPIAMINFVDSKRVWVKASVGVQIQEVDRQLSICTRVIEQEDCVVIHNIQEEASLYHEIVQQYDLCFYAGVPLKVRSGHNIGTLCILDNKPRNFDSIERTTLKQLAQLVIDQLELQRSIQQSQSRQRHVLSMLAHELKNPLSIIPTTAEVLKEELAEARPDLVPFIRHLERAGQRMSHLINDILELGKLQADEINLHKTRVDITGLLARITGTALIFANAKQQRLLLDIKDDIIVLADETKLGEVFENLLSNAIKYSEPGKDVAISVTREKNHACIKFIDQGPGLQAEDFHKIFQPFTRLSAKPTGGENSTGLGLSIVKLLTEAHGGSIKVHNNEDGIGACFTVKIPLDVTEVSA